MTERSKQIERIRRAATELLTELESENPELLALLRQRSAFRWIGQIGDEPDCHS